MSKQQCPVGDMNCYPLLDLASAQAKMMGASDEYNPNLSFASADYWAKWTGELWAIDQQEYLKQKNSIMSQSGNAYKGTSQYFMSYQDRLAYYFSLGTNNEWVMWVMIVLFVIILYRWINWMFREESGRKITRRMLWTLLLIILVFFVHTMLLAYF